MQRDRKRVVCAGCGWQSLRVDRGRDGVSLGGVFGCRFGFCRVCGGRMVDVVPVGGDRKRRTK